MKKLHLCRESKRRIIEELIKSEEGLIQKLDQNFDGEKNKVLRACYDNLTKSKKDAETYRKSLE